MDCRWIIGTNIRISIAAIDAAGVQAAARRFVDLNHMQWVAVGDRKQIQDALSKYGPVTVVDVNGKAEK